MWRMGLELLNLTRPVDTFLFSWSWCSTIWYHWYMYFQLKQIRRDCHRLLTEYSTKSHSRPLILTAKGTWQVLFWAGLLITYTCIFSTNNIQAAKHRTLSPSNSRCWWASCNFHNHKSLTSYPYISFKIWQASQFPSLSGSKDSLPNRSKPLHLNHQRLWTKHET